MEYIESCNTSKYIFTKKWLTYDFDHTKYLIWTTLFIQKEKESIQLSNSNK